MPDDEAQQTPDTAESAEQAPQDAPEDAPQDAPEDAPQDAPEDSADSAPEADPPADAGAAAAEAIESASAAASEVAEGAADPATPVDEEMDDKAAAALKAAQEAIASVKSGTDGDETDGSPAPVALDESSAGADANPAEGFTLPSVTATAAHPTPSEVDLLADVDLHVKIELGRTHMFVEDILKLGEGSVVELDKAAGDPVDVYVNDRRVARGEVLVINDCFCVRVSEIISTPTTE